MTTVAAASRSYPRRHHLGRHRGLFIAIGVFVFIIVGLDLLTPGPLSYFEFSYISAGGGSLALLSMGETIAVLAGGFDLSAGAVVSLVNALLATNMQDTVGSQILWSVLAIAIGAGVGAVNGFFIAVLRLQSIVVTLATMFIIQGVTLLVMERPGGSIPYTLTGIFTGDVIPNVLPSPVVVVALALAVWLVVKRTRFGTAIYAIGADPEAARANGVPVTWATFFTYVLAGCFYGASGLFISAQTGAGDPLVGAPMLLPMFAAVVLGGTVLGGGRGGCLGSIFGAYILMLTVNILLVLDISPFYTTVIEGVILILAVIGSSLGRGAPIYQNLQIAATRLGGLARGITRSRPAPMQLVRSDAGLRPNDELIGPWWQQWLRRHREALRFVLPSYVLLLIVVVATVALFGGRVFSIQYLNSLLMLTVFLAVLGLGQGAVILTGGLDLSVPWVIGFCAILLTGLTAGSDLAAIWAIPAVLLVGAVIGAVNGMGIVLIGLPPIVMTIAANGILEGIALIYVDPEKGAMVGSAPQAAIWFMEGRLLGLAPVVWFLILFVIGGSLLFTRTTFGRRLYALGSSKVVAKLSGVRVGWTTVIVYVLSGLCSSLVGMMLIGLAKQGYRGMGDRYLLPAIAVVVVGGTLVTGGRGHYLGIFGGALLLTALDTLMSGTTWSQALRDIIFGMVVLAAIITLREKKT